MVLKCLISETISAEVAALAVAPAAALVIHPQNPHRKRNTRKNSIPTTTHVRERRLPRRRRNKYFIKEEEEQKRSTKNLLRRRRINYFILNGVYCFIIIIGSFYCSSLFFLFFLISSCYAFVVQCQLDNVSIRTLYYRSVPAQSWCRGRHQHTKFEPIHAIVESMQRERS